MIYNDKVCTAKMLLKRCNQILYLLQKFYRIKDRRIKKTLINLILKLLLNGITKIIVENYTRNWVKILNLITIIFC